MSVIAWAPPSAGRRSVAERLVATSARAKRQRLAVAVAAAWVIVTSSMVLVSRAVGPWLVEQFGPDRVASAFLFAFVAGLVWQGVLIVTIVRADDASAGGDQKALGR